MNVEAHGRHVTVTSYWLPVTDFRFQVTRKYNLYLRTLNFFPPCNLQLETCNRIQLSNYYIIELSH
jgi:hypothetical protein